MSRQPRIESELNVFFRNTTKVELMEMCRDYAERCLGGGVPVRKIEKELRFMRRRLR